MQSENIRMSHTWMHVKCARNWVINLKQQKGRNGGAKYRLVAVKYPYSNPFAKVYFILHSVHHIIFNGFKPSEKIQTSGFVLLSLKVESLQFWETIIWFFYDISPPLSDVQSTILNYGRSRIYLVSQNNVRTSYNEV